VRRARTDPNVVAWRASLGGGLVVAVTVWGLLEALRRQVVQIDEGVDAVWTAGKRLAQNTQTVHILTSTRDGGVELLHELERHRDTTGGPQP
jgi:hypothetical protein